MFHLFFEGQIPQLKLFIQKSAYSVVSLEDLLVNKDFVKNNKNTVSIFSEKVIQNQWLRLDEIN